MSWIEVSFSLPGTEHIVRMRSNDSVAILATTRSIIAVESITPPSYRTIASLEGTIIDCDIAQDGSLGVVLTTSSGELAYQRYRLDGTRETHVALPARSLRAMALSRGGNGWIAANGTLHLYTIGRQGTTVQTDTSIAELVLSIRRQPTGDLLATTADGGIYRAPADSILSVETVQLHMVETFPNPASDAVEFRATTSAITEVAIYDVCGRCVAREQFSNPTSIARVKLPTIAPGYYTARIHTIDGTSVQPLVIVR
jgi:hypothetical protein